MNLKDNNFIGVQWDGKAIDAVNSVAQGLLNLTTLFSSQEIHIDSMLRIEPQLLPKKKTIKKKTIKKKISKKRK